VAVDVGAEREVAAVAFPDDGIETRLQDREAVAVPGVDARAGDVDDGDLDGRALERHHGHGRAADVPGADAADLHHGLCALHLPVSETERRYTPPADGTCELEMQEHLDAKDFVLP
jgi:hypothetical protein